MFIALNSNNERISIENATKNDQYFCPICGELLTIRSKDSLAVRTHFAHKRGTHCFDDWTHDMSEWHLSWQKQFPEQYREVVIEKDGIKHRADICIANVVIEFQHSPIKGEEIAKRNEFYLSCGYNVVWVFDATDKIKNSIGDSLDPMQCEANDLCWKRAKQEFSNPMPQGVTAYLQYKTCTSDKRYPNQEFEIMLLLTKLTPKGFSFYKTSPYYITPPNFVQECGIKREGSYSIKQIIDESKQNNRPQQYIRTQKPISRPTYNRRKRWL